MQERGFATCVGMLVDLRGKSIQKVRRTAQAYLVHYHAMAMSIIFGSWPALALRRLLPLQPLQKVVGQGQSIGYKRRVRRTGPNRGGCSQWMPLERLMGWRLGWGRQAQGGQEPPRSWPLP